MRLNSAPVGCNVPFANERDLQRFIVQNAKALLGLEVIASTLPNGRPIHKVDILAVDPSDRVHAIECKRDAIDSTAVRELSRYREALLRDWPRVEQRVAEFRKGSVRLARDPVLVAIGYRLERPFSAAAPPIDALLFKYDGHSFPRLVRAKVPGRAYLDRVRTAAPSSARHPEVLKITQAESRLAQLPNRLQKMFWAIDRRLQKIDGVRPKYSGKITSAFATYWRDRRRTVTVSVVNDLIVWHRIGSNLRNARVAMDADSDRDAILEILLAWLSARRR